ncbi:sensor histidine kinase [Streptomyces sp. NPDC017979]|uniref:sensor histidine kinase n=1 Tax=Streptomyces sp. NPDC017979 TaxID=3365024 RepID=UPI0037A701C2
MELAAGAPPWSAVVALPAVAGAAVVVWALLRVRKAPDVRARLAAPTAVCALASLTSTVTSVAVGATAGGVGTAGETRGYWSLAEAGVLLLLIVAVVRWSPARERRYAVALAGLAVVVWPAALIEGAFLERVGAAAFWLLPVAGAVATGTYPRLAARRRADEVARARRAQRLQLSRDLHDFVAHDVSGIVVQAQAALFVAASDPAQAVPALERIERAGLSALAAMDRTVALLGDASDASDSDASDSDASDESDAASRALPGLDALPALVAEFGATGGLDARLEVSPAAADALPRETGTVAYRVVVEALTNVRRHAPGARRVDVRVVRTAAAVEVSVVNGPGAGGRRPLSSRRARGSGGLGIPALTEHAAAAGGALAAGPTADGGWRLAVTFPDAFPPRPTDPHRKAPHPRESP